MSEIELLPCPWCGADDFMLATVKPAAWWFVYCRECGANGPTSSIIVFERDDEISRTEACVLWNTRRKP